MTINERLIAARTGRHMTQKELSEKSGILEPSIRKYESGRLCPRIPTLMSLAAGMDMSVTDFLDCPPDIKRQAVLLEQEAWRTRDLETLRHITELLDPLREQARTEPAAANQKHLEDELLRHFRKLSETGQAEAVARLEELAQLTKYKRTRNRASRKGTENA